MLRLFLVEKNHWCSTRKLGKKKKKKKRISLNSKMLIESYWSDVAKIQSKELKGTKLW